MSKVGLVCLQFVPAVYQWKTRKVFRVDFKHDHDHENSMLIRRLHVMLNVNNVFKQSL